MPAPRRHFGELPIAVVSLGGAFSPEEGLAPMDTAVRRACPPHITLRQGQNWLPRMGGERIITTADSGRVMAAIRRLSRNGPDDKALLVGGKSSGGANAWNTFRLYYREIAGRFRRVALVLIDPHGACTGDGRVGSYHCDNDLWWPPSWSKNRAVFRVYDIFQQLHPRMLPSAGPAFIDRIARTLTGAAFDEASRGKLAMHIQLSGPDAPHHMAIVQHPRTNEVLRAAFRFVCWGT